MESKTNPTHRQKQAEVAARRRGRRRYATRIILNGNSHYFEPQLALFQTSV
jgi:hypothetical protein